MVAPTLPWVSEMSKSILRLTIKPSNGPYETVSMLLRFPSISYLLERSRNTICLSHSLSRRQQSPSHPPILTFRVCPLMPTSHVGYPFSTSISYYHPHSQLLYTCFLLLLTHLKCGIVASATWDMKHRKMFLTDTM